MANSSSNAVPACRGLTALALPDENEASFQRLCRVVGSKWSVVTPDILFSLRRGLAADTESAVLAFEQLFDSVDVPGVAELISRAAREHHSYGSLAAADTTA